MSKKIMGQDGKMYKVKKPFYKKVWFWLLAVVVVFAVTSGTDGNSEKASTDNNAKKISSSSKNETTESSNPLDQDFKVGDVVSYKGYEIKVNNVQHNNGTQYNEPKEGQQFVIVNITITNNTDKKQTYNSFD